MPTKSWTLSRRRMLQGVGASLCLPLLDAMAEEPKKPPVRLCCVYFSRGMSVIPAEHELSAWNWYPHDTGRNCTYTEVLKPLEPHRKDITVLSGFCHPLVMNLVSHNTADVWLTGANIAKGYQQTISLDQLVANQIGRETRIHSLQLASEGGIGNPCRTRTISFNKTGNPIPSEGDVVRTFNRLFGKDDALSIEETRQRLASKRSLLDLVWDDAKHVSTKLGKNDKQKMDSYLTSVREVEQRIQRAEAWLDKPKPKVAYDPKKLDVDGTVPVDFLRARYDMMRLAFQTDSTRVATFMTTCEGPNNAPQNQFPKYALGDKAPAKGHHGLIHDAAKGILKPLGLYDQWLTEQFAYFVDSLASCQEENGSLLDNTLILYGTSGSRSHSARDYGLLLAGGKNYGLRHQGHIKAQKDIRMSNIQLTLAQCAGLDISQFADSEGGLPLLTS